MNLSNQAVSRVPWLWIEETYQIWLMGNLKLDEAVWVWLNIKPLTYKADLREVVPPEDSGIKHFALMQVFCWRLSFRLQLNTHMHVLYVLYVHNQSALCIYKPKKC